LHEFIIVDRIIQSVLASTRKGSKVHEVTVEMGELLGLSKESVNLAFETLSKGTAIEGSRLVVNWIRGEVACPNCDYQGGLASIVAEHRIDPAFPCPVCGSPLKIERGNEWSILKVT
jgi:hydrogenase nickel insertion protein HypA